MPNKFFAWITEAFNGARSIYQLFVVAQFLMQILEAYQYPSL